MRTTSHALHRWARPGVFTAALLVSVAAAPAAVAAQSDPVPLPPAAPAAKPFLPPRFTTRTLSNGLRVALVVNHALPVVAVRVVLSVDSTADPVGKAGLFALSENVLRDGTTTRTADQLADSAVALGTDVSPVRFTTIPSHLDGSLALMADMLAHPSVAPAAVDGAKAELAARAQAQLQSAYTVPRRIFYALAYGADSPEARSVSATAASINALTPQDVADFQRRYFRPDQTWLVIVGDIDEHTLMPELERYFGDWQRGAPEAAEAVQTPAPRPTTIYLIDRPGAAQSAVYLGALGPAASSPDAFALEALGPIVGSAPTSRLQQNLRERHSYIYSANPWSPVWRRPPQPSTLYGSAAPYTPKTDSALIEWLGELRAVRGARPPTDAEIDAARARLVGALPSLFETDDRTADRVAQLIQLGRGADFYDAYVARISTITGAELAAAAAKYIDPDHLVIVVAGDRKIIETGLRAANIGPVVVIDDNGKPVGPSAP